MVLSCSKATARTAISTIVPANGRGAGRPKNTWIRQMEKCQKRMVLSDDMIQDRNACRMVLRSHIHTSGGAWANPKRGKQGKRRIYNIGVIGVLWATRILAPKENNLQLFAYVKFLSSYYTTFDKQAISEHVLEVCESEHEIFFKRKSCFFYIFCFWILPKIFSGIPEVGMKKISSINFLFTRNMNFWKKKFRFWLCGVNQKKCLWVVLSH